MNIRTIVTGASVVALALGTASPVAAHSVGVGDIVGTVNVGGDVGVDVAAEGSASSSGTDVNTGVAGSGSAGAGISVTPLLMSRADVESDTKASVAVSAANVRSDTDLSAFVSAEIKNDANVSQVQASRDNVAVTYKKHAKLLGFIPVTVYATTVVDGSGTVSVSYPWYGFLLVRNDDSLKGRVQSRVNTVLGAGASANADVSANAALSAESDISAAAQAAAQLSAEAQARLIGAIRTAMQEDFDAQANIKASANAAGGVNAQ